MSGSPNAEPSASTEAAAEAGAVVPGVVVPGVVVPGVVEEPVRGPVVADVLVERAVPVPDPLTDFFWVSGRDGLLRLMRCADCGFYVHPPSLPCARCLGRKVSPEPVSGRGVVHSRTVNVQQWTPGQPPYVIAVVELVEQPGLRLTTNILGCPPESVRIDQPVRVAFVARHGLHYPVFLPAAAPVG